jgi:hypothetical protein
VLNVSAKMKKRLKITVIMYVIKALIMEKIIMRISGVQTNTKIIKNLVENRICRIPNRRNYSFPPVLLVYRNKRGYISAH